MRNLSLLFLLIGFTLPTVQAQDDEVIPTQFLNVGLQMANLGPGLSVTYARGDAAYRQWTFNLDLFLVKDLRETQIDPFVQDQGRRYIYGKLNHLLTLSPTIGAEWPLFPISSLNAINVRGGLKLGPSLGFLNPYQVEILTPVPGAQFKYTIEIEAYDPNAHAYSDIFGRANFISSNIAPSLVAGLNLEAYAILDFTRSESNITGLILAGQADLYANPVPIMAEINGRVNRQSFFAVSLGVVFGKGW